MVEIRGPAYAVVVVENNEILFFSLDLRMALYRALVGASEFGSLNTAGFPASIATPFMASLVRTMLLTFEPLTSYRDREQSKSNPVAALGVATEPRVAVGS